MNRAAACEMVKGASLRKQSLAAKRFPYRHYNFPDENSNVCGNLGRLCSGRRCMFFSGSDNSK